LTRARGDLILAGVSLAELLTSLACAGLVLGGAFSLLHEGQRLYARGAARVEAQQSARAALERMATEIRQAGFGPMPSQFAAVAVAERSRITLQSDLDGDGAIAALRETVTWSLVGEVLRRNAGAGAQPIVNGVRELVFEYRDARGRVTAIPDEVRSVTITLTAEPDHVAGDPSRRALAVFTTGVGLRNR
jgi:Tfp pilus assembly protein PilW